MKRKNQDRTAGKARLALCKETVRELTLGDVEQGVGARAAVDLGGGVGDLAAPGKMTAICC